MPPPLRRSVVLLAAVAAIGGLVFGFDIGGAGGSFVMDGFKRQFGWIDSSGVAAKSEDAIAQEQGWINSILTLGAAFGAVPSGFIADAFGRKPCILASAAVFTAGASLQAMAFGAPANALATLYVGRFVGGIGIGMLSAVVPVYIAESAPEHARGMLSTLWQLAITTGIVLASLVNLPLARWEEGWRLSYGGNGIFSLILLLQMVGMPESPRWLGSHRGEAQVRTVLRSLRTAEEVEAEVAEIMASAAEERGRGRGAWADLLRRADCMRHRMLLGVGLMVFQTFSGMNAIMFYAPQILTEYFSSTAALYGTLGINFVNFLSTFITVCGVVRAAAASNPSRAAAAHAVPLATRTSRAAAGQAWPRHAAPRVGGVDGGVPPGRGGARVRAVVGGHRRRRRAHRVRLRLLVRVRVGAHRLDDLLRDLPHAPPLQGHLGDHGEQLAHEHGARESLSDGAAQGRLRRLHVLLLGGLRARLLCAAGDGRPVARAGANARNACRSRRCVRACPSYDATRTVRSRGSLPLPTARADRALRSTPRSRRIRRASAAGSGARRGAPRSQILCSSRPPRARTRQSAGATVHGPTTEPVAAVKVASASR